MVKSQHVNNNNGNDKANEVQAVREQELAEPPPSAEGRRPAFENDVHMSDDDLLQRKRQINRILDNSERSSSSSHPMQETSTSLPSATAGSTRAGQAVNALEEMDRAVAKKYSTASSSPSAVLGARSASPVHLQHPLDSEETHRESAEKTVSEETGNREDGGNPTDDLGAPRVSLVPGAYAVSGTGNGAENNATMEAENLLWDLMNHHAGAADDALLEIPVAQEPGDNHDGLVTAHPVMTEHDDEGPAQFALPAGNSTTTKRGLKKKHLWFIVFFVVSLVTVSVVGGVCGTGYCNDDTDTNGMPSVAPTSSRYMLIQDFQQEIEAVLGADYFEEAHPLFALRDQALHWIVNIDPLQLDVEATNLLQRFILTVFQYQTSQEKEWAACYPQEGGIDTCYHAGTDQIAMRWLSQTHECQWAGIGCVSEMEDDMNITEVDLSSMALSGGLPTELFQLSNLNKLILLRNSITGTIPTEISNLSYLTWLNFGENLLTGGLPSQILQLSLLERLFIRQNSISGSIPRDIFSHPALEEFVLHDNSLTGRLPVPAQPQTNMGVLFLDNNALTGMIPTEFAYLSSLNALYLDGNKGLSGNIPSEIGMISQLQEISLARTAVGGTIPEELYNGIGNLYGFFVADSAFSGTISTNLGLWTNLRHFSIGNNNFSGTFPDVQILSNLIGFTIHGNDLTGTFPMTACYSYQASNFQWPRSVIAQCAVANRSTEALVCPALVGCCTECCDIESGECTALR